MDRFKSFLSGNSQQQRAQDVLPANMQPLQAYNDCVETKLNKQALQYILDIGESSPQMEAHRDQLIQQLKDSSKEEDQEERDFLDYQKESAELLLECVDRVVSHDTLRDDYEHLNTIERLSDAQPLGQKLVPIRPTWPHLDHVPEYTFQSLQKSIYQVLLKLNRDDEQQTNCMMHQLRLQVNAALTTTLIFRSQHDNNLKLFHHHSLIIAFYSGVYQMEKKTGKFADLMGNNAAIPTQLKTQMDTRVSNLLSCTQQTLSIGPWESADPIQQQVLSTMKPQLDELIYWLNHAILQLNYSKVFCMRKVKITNQVELDYYQVGKVFRTQNVIGARHCIANNEIKKDHRNVIFQIHSMEGRSVESYVGHKTEADKIAGKQVLFPSGTEFLVCKREETDGMILIFLRQVNLGFAYNVVLWLDDQIFKLKNIRTWYWLKDSYNHCTHPKQRNTHYIFKSQSLAARSYFNSIFFQISLQMCDQFTFIQNTKREDQEADTRQEEDPEHAGVYLLQDFKRVLDSVPPPNQKLAKSKIVAAIFTNNDKDPKNSKNIYNQYVKFSSDKKLLYDSDWKRKDVKILGGDKEKFAHYLRAYYDKAQFAESYGMSIKPNRH